MIENIKCYSCRFKKDGIYAGIYCANSNNPYIEESIHRKMDNSCKYYFPTFNIFSWLYFLFLLIISTVITLFEYLIIIPLTKFSDLCEIISGSTDSFGLFVDKKIINCQKSKIKGE